MATPLNFRISPGNPSVPTDFVSPDFFLSFSNNFSVNNKGFTRVGQFHFRDVKIAAKEGCIIGV